MLHNAYDGLQGAGERDCCVVATPGVSKRNPCWPGWRLAGWRGQCVDACHRVLESSTDKRSQLHRQMLPIISIRYLICARLAENHGHKKIAKNRYLGTIAQLCPAISSQLRHV